MKVGGIDVVALRKESVDRNTENAVLFLMTASLSARRAWIEIPAGCWRESRRAVALRKESVDRNSTGPASLTVPTTSLSARRAWIEIDSAVDSASGTLVALRKESVDRNRSRSRRWRPSPRRSPQGERG